MAPMPLPLIADAETSTQSPMAYPLLAVKQVMNADTYAGNCPSVCATVLTPVLRGLTVNVAPAIKPNPVAPAAPAGMPKSRIAADGVPALATVAGLPGASVLVVPTETVPYGPDAGISQHLPYKMCHSAIANVFVFATDPKRTRTGTFANASSVQVAYVFSSTKGSLKNLT